MGTVSIHEKRPCTTACTESSLIKKHPLLHILHFPNHLDARIHPVPQFGFSRVSEKKSGGDVSKLSIRVRLLGIATNNPLFPSMTRMSCTTNSWSKVIDAMASCVQLYLPCEVLRLLLPSFHHLLLLHKILVVSVFILTLGNTFQHRELEFLLTFKKYSRFVPRNFRKETNYRRYRATL